MKAYLVAFLGNDNGIFINHVFYVWCLFEFSLTFIFLKDNKNKFYRFNQLLEFSFQMRLDWNKSVINYMIHDGFKFAV